MEQGRPKGLPVNVKKMGSTHCPFSLGMVIGV